MSRELDLIAREFQKFPATVLRTEVDLYQSSIQTATSAFLKRVEQECKRQKQSRFTLVAIITDKTS